MIGKSDAGAPLFSGAVLSAAKRCANDVNWPSSDLVSLMCGFQGVLGALVPDRRDRVVRRAGRLQNSNKA